MVEQQLIPDCDIRHITKLIKDKVINKIKFILKMSFLQVEAFKRDREFRQRQLRDDEQQRSLQQQQQKSVDSTFATTADGSSADIPIVPSGTNISSLEMNGDASAAAQLAAVAASGHPATIAVGQLSLADLEKALAKVEWIDKRWLNNLRILQVIKPQASTEHLTAVTICPTSTGSSETGIMPAAQQISLGKITEKGGKGAGLVQFLGQLIATSAANSTIVQLPPQQQHERTTAEGEIAAQQQQQLPPSTQPLLAMVNNALNAAAFSLAQNGMELKNSLVWNCIKYFSVVMPVRRSSSLTFL